MKTLVGYPVRLLLDLDGVEHDVTDCLEVARDGNQQGVEVNIPALLNEIAVERRVRERRALDAVDPPGLRQMSGSDET